MLERDCVVNSLHDYEIGSTPQEWVVYAKSRRGLSLYAMKCDLRSQLARFDLEMHVLAQRCCASGNVLKIQMTGGDGWD